MAIIPMALGALALRMTHQTACFPFLPRVLPTAVLRLLCSDCHWRESKSSAENLGGQRAEMAFETRSLPTLPSRLYLLCHSSRRSIQLFRHSTPQQLEKYE